MAPHKLPVDMRREQSAASDTSLSELSAGPTYYRQRRLERKLICYISTARDQSGPLTKIGLSPAYIMRLNVKIW